MPHSAVALVRTGCGWRGQEIDLAEIDDLDVLADVLTGLRDGDTGAEPGSLVVCFIEEDDEWLGIVRLVDDDDPRVFLSDARMVEQSLLAGRLFADALPLIVDPDEDADADERIRVPADPAGDLDIVADLGTAGDSLMELITEEGFLPSDIVTAICERAGAAEVADEVRGT